MPFNKNAQGYDESSLTVDYLTDMRRLTIPVSGPPGTAAVVVQTAAPIGSKAVTFAYQRTGVPPKIPSMKPVNSNEILKHFHLKIIAPSLMTEGAQHIWRTEGSYLYDLLVPIGPGDSLPAPVQAYDQNPPGIPAVQPSDYVTGLVPAETAQPNLPALLNLITH